VTSIWRQNNINGGDIKQQYDDEISEESKISDGSKASSSKRSIGA